MDPFLPGAGRAGEHFSGEALLAALVGVEAAWVGHDLPAVAPSEIGDLEGGGNPVVALVPLLRERSGDPGVHVGLTSQDVVDTALMLMARDAVAAVCANLRALTETLVSLAGQHAETVMVARTLTQHAVPTTFGLKAAGWLGGVLDAWDDLAALRFPVQVGGAGGTNAALVALGRDPREEARRLAEALGLDTDVPWHTNRRPMTRNGDALVATATACGRLANDVATLSRPEIGEVTEGSPGGSSTMPHKQNPVLAVLVRSAALAAPPLGATLHAAAAHQGDERADGAWHAEWAALRDLARRVVVSTSQTADLAEHLVVHADRMASTLAAAEADVLAEQRVLTGSSGAVTDYLGEAEHLIGLAVVRAEERLA